MEYNERIKCGDCGKFIKEPYDSRTTFGCADPSAPEPYDPDFFCKKCSKKRYEKLLVEYKCCKRSGDYNKSDAEIRAAKEAGLVWIHGSSLIEKSSGRNIHYEYIREGDRGWRYIPYLEYHKKLREEDRCKCNRKKDKNGKCPTCSRDEVFCLCKYNTSLF